MKRVTVKQIMSWGPCGTYPEERVKKIIGRGVVRSDVWGLELDEPADYLWLVLRPEFLPDEMLHKISIFCWEKIARPIWEAHYPNDRRPHEAVRVKKLWMKGKASDKELVAAGVAARAAARAAAGSAAGVAARSAARSAAGVAAGDAAWDAAWAAAWDAAWAAAWAASRDAAGAAAYKKIIAYVKKQTGGGGG